MPIGLIRLITTQKVRHIASPLAMEERKKTKRSNIYVHKNYCFEKNGVVMRNQQQESPKTLPNYYLERLDAMQS